MSTAVAKVAFLQGQAWAKAPDGTMRALTVGSTLNDDEILVTATGAKVELDTGNGEPLTINGGLNVGMSRDLLAQTATESDEALLSDASVQEALTVLEQGGDLLDELEETAAGNSGGSGSDGGSNFVRLTRLIESTDSQSFDFERASQVSREEGESDGEFVNHAPVVTNQTVTTNEDESFTGQIIAEDLEGDALTYALNTRPTNGTLVLDPVTGQFTFTPNANYNGPDSFVVTVTDSHGNSSDTSITLNVAPVNDAPTTNDITLTTDEDVAVTGQVVAEDIEGDTLAYAVSGNPTNGTVTVNAATGAFVYTPNTNYNGSDSFVVTISDGKGGTTTSTVNIGVTPVNDAPVSSNQNLTTAEDVALSGQIAASDVDGDTLAYAVTGNPTNGTVTLNSATGVFTYTPAANYNGSDSFVVTISDGNGGTTTSTVNIGVTPVNDAPVSANQNLTTAEDVALSGQITASDVDGDTLTYAVTGNPANGTLTLNAATGSFVYTPNANYNGSDSFVVTISDGKGGTTTSTVNIGVTPVNNAPVSADQNLTTDEDVALSGQIAATDVDGDTLVYAVTGNPANGTLTLNTATGAFVYTPNTNYNGSDSFVVSINDGKGGTTTSTVNVGVTPVNDVPVANNDTATVDEDGSVVVAVRANDTDGDGDVLTVTGVTQGANGSVVIDVVTGNPIYTPNTGFSGTDSFTYLVSDSKGGTATATVNVTVNPVNDAPVITITQVNNFVEDAGAAVGDVVATYTTSDADGDTVTVTLSDTVNYALDGSGNVTLTAAGLALVNSGADLPAFTLTPNDGTVNGASASADPSVTAANDAPVITITQVNNFVEDAGAAVGDVVATYTTSDADGDTVTVTLSDTVNYALNGNSVTLTAAGLALVNSGADLPAFTLTPSDGKVSGAAVSVDPKVTPVNDAPVSIGDSISVLEGGTATVLVSGATSVLANDSDAENNALTAVLVIGPTNGALTLNANGTFSYTHNGGETTSDQFTYRANDGTANGNIVTVNISVTAVNDAPQTNVATATGNEDSLITVVLTGSDVDGTVAGFVIKTLPANGVLYSNLLMTTSVTVGDLVTGPVYFMPSANWNGSTSFTYAAQDNLGLQDATPATASITVSPVADAAVISAGTGSVKEDTPAQSSASGALTINDPDAGESTFVAQTNTAGTYGTFSIDTDGNWVFNIDNTKADVQRLKAGETKTETFTVTSFDGTPGSVTITVIGTNDGPVAVADTATVNQGAVLTLTPAQLLANDTDLDGDTLSIDSVQGASNGTVSLVNGNVVFTPNVSFYGPTSFTYTLSDGNGGSSTATVSVNVIKTNHDPVANSDSAAATAVSNVGLVSEYFGFSETAQGANLSSIQQAYSYINGRTADATFIAKTFDYGSASTFSNNLGYGTNLQDFLGSDAASLSADPASTSDAIIRMRGFVELGAGTYNFKVTADDGYQIRVDGVVVAQVNSNQSSSTTTHNTFTLAAGGLHTVEVVYWDQGGYAKLKLELSDDAGTTYKLLSAVPAYQHTVFSAVEDTALSIPANALLANDTDADGDTLSIQSVQGAVNGSVSLVAGSVVFTPVANYNGPASFTYTISDGKGGTATATVNLSVAPVNDAPVAADDNRMTGMNTKLIIPFTGLLANDVDVDGETNTLVSVQNATNGTATIMGANIDFIPNTNFEGPASFTYTIRDAYGATSTATVNIVVGSASAPSVVVSKALIATAHGTGGASVKFPIITQLVDNDGSESLSIKISGVPTGLSFNAGTNLGGGVWQFVSADLPNLALNLPGSYTTNSTNLTVQVTSTEINGGATASTSTVVTLKAAYTTVDITTTDGGNYTGSSASEYIQGGNGDNVINASSGNNVVYGHGGNDTLTAGSGSDILFGGSGNDIINAGSGADRIIGGAGNDTLKGGDAGESFVDVFAWSLGDQGAAGAPAVDTIQNFATGAAGTSTAGGDVLDLRDLLQGEHVGASNAAGNLTDYLHFEVSGSDTIVHISHTGGFAADSHTVSASYTSASETQQIVLSGVNLQSLYSGATTDQQIITQLLNNNKLITD